MRVQIQWTTDPAQGFIDVDHTQWNVLAKNPYPVGGEIIDLSPGWIYSIAIQGVRFSGYDHYAVLPTGIGAVSVICWNDDPADWSVYEMANNPHLTPETMPPPGFHANAWMFYPLVVDPKTKNNQNTKQKLHIYAEDSRLNVLPAKITTTGGEVVKRGWNVFTPPNKIARHGIWISDELADAHNKFKPDPYMAWEGDR